MNFQKETQNRITNRKQKSLFDVNTILEHFAIISFKVPVDRIKKYIPKRFELWTFKEGGKEYALISAVPFKDQDFSFYRLSKFPKFNFYQTNYRAYVIDKKDNAHVAWFFGTTLGSLACMIPEKIWKMPWKKGSYYFDYEFNNSVYSKYNMTFNSAHGKGKVDIISTKEDMKLHEGFTNLDEQIHILTHPVKGYYQIDNHLLGEYEIWHPKIELKECKVKHVYFEFFEKLELLTKEEMKTPHSVLITPKIEFDILLPPEKIKNGCK